MEGSTAHHSAKHHSAVQAGLPAARHRGARPIIVAALGLAVAAVTVHGPAAAHGFAGKRFFPATITVDDPFVADELSLPTISTLKEAGGDEEPETRETEFSAEFAKTITDRFGFSVEVPFVVRDPKGEPTKSGFGNTEVALRYQFLTSAEHEAVASAALGWEIGGSGARRVDSPRFSTLTPSLFFGKGFGDLPDGAKYLRPFAITGVLGVALPTEGTTTTAVLNEDTGEVEVQATRNPDVLVWGGTVQYSLRYLQSFVKDIGLGAPFNGITPLVEFLFETPLDRGGGPTTGTINPGLIWSGQSIQLGIEAVVPINDSSGVGTGVLAQLHFYLDDIFPTTLGRPLFAR
ncbi:MAG: hypothetical protein WCF16_00915 [Alphaproteobacteria bacterium]